MKKANLLVPALILAAVAYLVLRPAPPKRHSDQNPGSAPEEVTPQAGAAEDVSAGIQDARQSDPVSQASALAVTSEGGAPSAESPAMTGTSGISAPGGVRHVEQLQELLSKVEITEKEADLMKKLETRFPSSGRNLAQYLRLTRDEGLFEDEEHEALERHAISEVNRDPRETVLALNEGLKIAASEPELAQLKASMFSIGVALKADHPEFRSLAWQELEGLKPGRMDEARRLTVEMAFRAVSQSGSRVDPENENRIAVYLQQVEGVSPDLAEILRKSSGRSIANEAGK